MTPFEVGSETVWRDVFDQLSASEQLCFEGLFDIDDLDANLDRRLTSFTDQDLEEEADVDASIYGCLNQGTATGILTEIWLMMLFEEVALLQERADEVAESCVRDVLVSVDVMQISFPNPDPQGQELSEAEYWTMVSNMALCWNLPPASELDAPQGEIVWHYPSSSIVLGLLSEDAIYGLDYASPLNSIVALDRMNGDVLWRYEFAETASYDRDPHIFTLVDGVVYVSNNDLLAIDASSGKLLWEHRDIGLPENLVVANGMVYYYINYYVTENGEGIEALLGADAVTGEVLWIYEEYPYSNKQSFAVGDGAVYVGRLEDDLQVLDSRTGQRVPFNGEPRWQDARRYFGVYDRKIVDAVVYWLDRSGLEAKDALTGETLWQYEAEIDAGTDAVIFDGYAYLWSSHHDSIFAVDLSEGELAWTFRTRAWNFGLTTANGIAYLVSLTSPPSQSPISRNRASGRAYALNAITGDLLWEYQTTDAPLHQLPTVANRVVYVGGKGLYALDAADGELLWYYLVDLIENSPPMVKDEIVYVADLGRGVFALKAPHPE